MISIDKKVESVLEENKYNESNSKIVNVKLKNIKKRGNQIMDISSSFKQTCNYLINK